MLLECGVDEKKKKVEDGNGAGSYTGAGNHAGIVSHALVAATTEQLGVHM